MFFIIGENFVNSQLLRRASKLANTSLEAGINIAETFNESMQELNNYANQHVDKIKLSIEAEKIVSTIEHDALYKTTKEYIERFRGLGASDEYIIAISMENPKIAVITKRILADESKQAQSTNNDFKTLLEQIKKTQDKFANKSINNNHNIKKENKKIIPTPLHNAMVEEVKNKISKYRSWGMSDKYILEHLLEANKEAHRIAVDLLSD